MRPDERIRDQLSMAEKKTRDALKGANGDGSPNAATLLTELALCQRGLLSLIQRTVSTIEPVAKQSLASVVFTLTGLIQATEMAAIKVLDEAEGLGNDRDRISKALTRIQPFVNMSEPTAASQWAEAEDGVRKLFGRVLAIMSAMAFQDLTAQHLNVAIQSLEETRGRLLQLVAVLEVPVDIDEPVSETLADKITNPGTTDGSHQALADQLWAEMKER
jgi:chemotaxis regulatin CheY-phosphate phosphatase CheZ